MRNIYSGPNVQRSAAALKPHLAQLHKEDKDDDQFASEQPKERSYAQAPPVNKW